jgi:diguanylate cyclase (GGDEF)-like protein/PAS domain S-box-containing protein
MQIAIDARPPANSPCEGLIEFLYLTPVGLIEFQPCGTIDMANPAAAQLLLPLVRGAELSNIYEALQTLAPDLRNRVTRFTPPSGQICDQLQLPVPGTHTVLTLGINKINPGAFMAVIQDISRAIEQEERIRDDQQRLRAIFDNIRDYAIYTVDITGRLDGWNRSLNRVGGWDRADVAGASVACFFSVAADGAELVADLLNRARQGGSAEIEGWVFRKDGSAFWASTVATALPDRDGRPHGFVFVTRDLTERKRMEDRLVTLATTDPLTGTYNRRAGEAGLADAFKQWSRYASAFTVAMIDIDHFKNVNDRWGHDVGDNVLVYLTGLFREKLRDKDQVIRWGGEEFLLLFPDTGIDVAQAIAERLRAAIAAAEIPHGSERIAVTASFGVATAAAGDNAADDVIKRADEALYAAKRTGRNRVFAG